MNTKIIGTIIKTSIELVEPLKIKTKGTSIKIREAKKSKLTKLITKMRRKTVTETCL
jgi:hypothetical protein